LSVNGKLTEISVMTGRRFRSLNVPDTITSAAGDPTGSVAVVSGKRG